MRLSKPTCHPSYTLVQPCGNEACEDQVEATASLKKEARADLAKAVEAADWKWVKGELLCPRCVRAVTRAEAVTKVLREAPTDSWVKKGKR
jgi:hypothetical protein